jgi:hypothetical protein
MQRFGSNEDYNSAINTADPHNYNDIEMECANNFDEFAGDKDYKRIQ